jgi:hypothetical protein
MAKTGSDRDVVFDSCALSQKDPVFCVVEGCGLTLMACGIPDGVEIPVMMYVGNVEDDCSCPLVVNGEAAVLSADNNVISRST